MRLGELGNGTTTGPQTCKGLFSCSTRPVPVSGITNAIQVAAGLDHTCTLLSGGQVDCWGDNEVGELGNGTTTQSAVPVPVSGITTATQIAAGTYHTCACCLAPRSTAGATTVSESWGTGPPSTARCRSRSAGSREDSQARPRTRDLISHRRRTERSLPSFADTSFVRSELNRLIEPVTAPTRACNCPRRSRDRQQVPDSHHRTGKRPVSSYLHLCVASR